MSNVRPSCMNTTSAPSYATYASERISSLGGSPAVPARAECRLRAARAARPSAVGAPPALFREGELSIHSSSGSLVKKKLQNSAFVHARFIKKNQQPQSLSAAPRASLKTRFVGAGPHKDSSSPRERQYKDRGVVRQGLTLPSRGCPKGCAFCAPLMSNVRRHESTEQ